MPDADAVLGAMSEAELRTQCLVRVDVIRSLAVDARIRRHLAIEFSESARDRIDRLLCELEAAIAVAQIVHRRHRGGKGHLRVVWSAS
jgi:hypothetical protein